PQRHDAEDVFQAAFLVLARKAAGVRWRASVGGWLYQVAYRLARKARAVEHRRRARERLAANAPRPEPAAALTWDEARAVLDEELDRLPEKYRLPLLHCYLEGQTRDQASRRLGWSLRTLDRRLDQAKTLLRHRLTRRGVTLPAALLTAGLAQPATASVPAALLTSTLRSATAFASGGTNLAPAGALANDWLRHSAAARLKLAAVLLLTTGLAALGTDTALL